MNNQTRKIVVICDSDVILKGFGDILTGSDSDEILLLHQVNDLLDYPHLLGYILIILPDSLLEKEEVLLKEFLSKSQDYRILPFSLKEISVSSNDMISLQDNSSLIIEKVNKSLQSFESGKEEKNELSKRERDVLRLVAKGYSNKAIADELNISIHTVISHRKNISEKTSIKSISGLTMYAVLMKIIDIDEVRISDLI